jgi:hypothetical protein
MKEAMMVFQKQKEAQAWLTHLLFTLLSVPVFLVVSRLNVKNLSNVDGLKMS